MKKYASLLFTIFLTLIVLLAINSFIKYGKTYIGQDYYDSDEIQNIKNNYLLNLEKYVLNPPDKEKTLENLKASSEEIKYYRYYYGDLDTQIMNIMDQYEYKISMQRNSETVNEQLITDLVAERDAKIEAVRLNFTDNTAIEEKILAAKKQAVETYFEKYEAGKEAFENSKSMFGYSLVNKETKKSLENNEGEKIIRTYNVSFPNYVESEETYIDNNDDIGLKSDEPIRIVINRTKYNGKVYLLKEAFEASDNKWDYRGFYYSKYMSFSLWGIGLLALILLFTKFKWTSAHLEQLRQVFKWFSNKPQDLLIVGTLLVGMILLNFIDNSSYIIHNIAYNYGYLSFSNLIELIIRFAMYSFLLTFFITLLEIIIKNFKTVPLENLWNQSITCKVINMMKELFLNRSIGIQTIGMFIVFFLGGVGLVVASDGSEQFIIYAILFMFILVPTFIFYLVRMATLNRVIKQTEQMAQGKLTNPIKVHGQSPIAKHARNLNDLQEGVKKSVTEQAKSERLKTELITNVSHDLRTPLTSIITYTDLLKNPDLTPEERASYVNVLDRKADRLKVLIEDLFEVSKMASGNIEITKQRIDIALLIQQIAGEYIADFEEMGLDLRTSISQQPLFAEVDGQKLWRVCENLLNNAKKYSLKGTRVYMQLTQLNNEAILTLKNVSHYELQGDAEELTERFKRADLARHTEGSGLGLAIASSIIDLHNGTLSIEADGDLFKVTVKIPC